MGGLLPNAARARGLLPDDLRELVRPAEGYEYGGLLPFRKNIETGEIGWGTPGIARDFVRGAADLLEGPYTGKVTPEANLSLMQMLMPPTRLGGMVLGAGSRSGAGTAGLAGRLADQLRQMGATVNHDASKISESKYLYAKFPGMAEDASPVKIRVSDHPSPPRYADADYEISGSGAHGAWGMDEGIEAIARKFGLEVPKDTAKALSKKRADEAKLTEQTTKAREEAASRIAAETDQARTAFPAEWEATLAMDGPARREAQRQLRLRGRQTP